MKNRILNNIFYNGAVQVSGILLNLLLMPYITRVLGTEALGINSFGQSIAGYFVLLGNLGITIYGAKAIAERRDNKLEKQKKFSECVTYQFVFNLIALLLFNLWVKCQGSNIYFLFNIVILTSMTDLSWAYTGMERFDLIALRNLVIKFIGTLLVFIAVRNETDLSIFIIIQQGVLLISNIVFWIELNKIGIFPSFAPFNQAIRNVFRPAIVVFIPSIFTSFYLSLNKVMLGYLSTIDEVAIYDYPNRLVRIAITFIGIIGTVMMPRLAYLNNSGLKDEFRNKIKMLVLYSLLVSIPCFFILELISVPLCEMFLGASFVGSDSVIKIVAPTLITSGLSLYVVFVSLNRMKDFTKCVSIAACVSFLLNLYLMPQLGAIGAAISLLVTEMVVHLLLLLYLRDIYSLRSFIGLLFRLIILNGVLYFVVLLLFDNITTVVEMFGSVMVYLLFYALFLFVLIKKGTFLFAR